MGMQENKLLAFVKGVMDLTYDTLPEKETLIQAGKLMADLVATDDWLPERFAIPHHNYYQQYLLYGDPQGRFSVVSFVWGPGQKTPIHDHTVWGVVGMLRGAEISQRFEITSNGLRPRLPAVTLKPGSVELLSPTEGDIHQVSNSYPDSVSISIHLYGGNIGQLNRSVFSKSGESRSFVSGYSSDVVPSLWADTRP
jgi:predicted metal-dependent enzyme (double-stranded beta helix superfamily)